MTQEEVARSLEWHPSKLLRIEGGKTGIQKVDLLALLARYSASPSRTARLLELHQGAKKSTWWDKYRNHTSADYLTYVGYEAGASTIRQFQLAVIPGLLQTRAYAEALASDTGVGSKQQITLRLQRQRQLRDRENPPEEFFILHESAIRQRIGVHRDPSIMPAQLQHIVDIGERSDHITISVLPVGAGGHVGMLLGAFTLLTFQGGLSDLLYLESGGTASTITGTDPRIIRHQEAFEVIQDKALPPTESLDLIRAVEADLA